MSIRDVASKVPPSPAGGAGAGGLPASLDKGLKDNGFVQTGQSTQDAASNLSGGLRAQGFAAPATLSKADFAVQLGAALKQFQAAQGLPPTGKLDAATAQALKNAGLNGQPTAPQADQLAKGDRDNFEKQGAQSLLSHGANKRVELVNQAAPDTNFLDALLNKLGPGGPNEGTSSSDIKGAAPTHDAKVEGKAATENGKKGEGANKKGSTSESNHKDLDLTNQQLDRGHGQGVKVMRGLKSETTKTEEKRRRDALAGKDATELGILDEEADEDALQGAGDDGNKRGAGGGAHDGGQNDSGDDDGTERTRGNASSGDSDHADSKRGHASVDDGSDDGAGHYRVPTLAEQAHQALALIKKDASADNRATTYSWDVMFLRPGVYGAGQKAEELVHLAVDKAAAFDPVWQKAQLNLVALVQRGDPTGEAPSVEDILAALRRARAQDGGPVSKLPLTLVKPMGRA